MRRLPRYEPLEEELRGDPPSAPEALPGHLVGVLVVSPRLDGSVFVDAVLESLASRGFSPDVVATPATPHAPPYTALRDRISALRAAVSVGALGIAHFRPRIAIAFTGGEPRTRWSKAARALEERLDLALAEPRPAVFDALAERLALAACPGDPKTLVPLGT